MYSLSSELAYSKRQIRDAGKLLRGVVQKSPDVEEAFRILHNWRRHNAYPMVRERAKLTQIVKPQSGFTAGRLKRTTSIRKKLLRTNIGLDRIQDLVGCRAILPNMNVLNETLEKYEKIESGGRVLRVDDYVAKPKASGYRSCHLIIKFDENGFGQNHRGCKVELQLRTQLQHDWATTVEAAGTMLNEDLKAGEGDPNWLRFFSLIGGHFAELEGQPRGQHMSMSYNELKAETIELSRQLKVLEKLETFSTFMNEAEIYDGSHNSNYILKFDADTGNISVRAAWRELFEFADLDEQPGEEFQERSQSLEIHADSMKALRQAYPNYFADTKRFLEVLKELEGPIKQKTKDTFADFDLSFLSSITPPKKHEKQLSLRNTGYVFWDDEMVGTWDKGNYENYFFRQGTGQNVAVQAEGRNKFRAMLKRWLETK